MDDRHRRISQAEAILLTNGAGSNELLDETKWKTMAWELLIERIPRSTSTVMASARAGNTCQGVLGGRGSERERRGFNRSHTGEVRGGKPAMRLVFVGNVAE